MKFLILLFYYERPEMLRRSLESIKRSQYDNWELCVIDDGVKFSANTIIDEVFSRDQRIIHRISCMQTLDSKENKDKRGGSNFGLYANCAIKASDADIVFMLCDDDLIREDYMQRLSEFYINNPDIKYSYCHLGFFNPLRGDPSEENRVKNDYTQYLIENTGPVAPARRLDSSQVSWRREPWLDSIIRFPYPQTKNLDETIYEQMYVSWGACHFNEITGQWKGIHDLQLVNL